MEYDYDLDEIAIEQSKGTSRDARMVTAALLAVGERLEHIASLLAPAVIEQGDPEIKLSDSQELALVKEDEPKQNLPAIPTKDSALSMAQVNDSLHKMGQFDKTKAAKRTFQVMTVFGYWVQRAGKDNKSTLFTRDRYTRLERFVRQRGIDWCLYVVDGGMEHPDLNHDSGRTWHELENFFSLKTADRAEKLVEITNYQNEPRHPMVARHPELADDE